MDIEEIKQLIQLMVDNDLSEVDIADGESKISLKRGPGDLPVVTALPPAAAPAPPASEAAPPEPPAEELLEIRSPMVGTFYASSSPDSDLYVAVGTSVGEETVVCIIEAMKVMNEIKAECSGTITEICVKNAQPVEFGQVLFRVRPA